MVNDYKYKIEYLLSNGIALDDGWVQMEIPISDFDLLLIVISFGIIFNGEGIVSLVDIMFLK